VSIDGDTVLVGAPRDEDFGLYSGSAYVFVRGGTTWSQQAKLTAGDGAVKVRFGNSVSVDDNTALIGACFDDDNGPNAGAAYVFVRSESTWSQQAKLTANDGGNRGGFGGSVDLDGGAALISGYGSAYVFVRSVGGWSQQAKLTAEDAWHISAVRLEGDTALAGSLHFDRNEEEWLGAAYVFVRSGTTWSQQAKFTASDAAANDFFGYSVCVDGDTAVIGAVTANSAYVFVRSGTTWSQQAKFTADDGANDEFGFSVSVEGDTALIGARHDDDSGADSGSAYVFVRGGTAWSQLAKLTAGDAAAGDEFGSSVSLNADTALIGASGDNDSGSDSGSAYVFARDGTAWTQQIKLTADDGAAGDRFGRSVSLDGNTALIGAFLADGLDADGGTSVDQGSAYVFRLEETTSGPEIVVDDGAGTGLADGATQKFGTTPLGSPLMLTFTIRNDGVVDLTGISLSADGTDASDFTVAGPGLAELAPGESTTFSVTFAPASSGAKTAALHIASNDADENPFVIHLTGRALSSADDTDGDGMNDVAEWKLVPLGFDWEVANPALVDLYFEHAGANGLQPRRKSRRCTPRRRCSRPIRPPDSSP
jgi:hypothetical protein